MLSFNQIYNKIFGDPNDKEVKQIEREVVARINALEPEIQKLTDAELVGKTAEFKKMLADGQTVDDLLIPAFAVVREAARRVLGLRHFDVQLIGGYALHRGRIAEMRTGEGKTLTSTLAIYLNALSDEGVHVVTVNDYLAKRDACWMGQVYSFLGLSIGIIQNQLVSFLYDEKNSNADYLERLIPCARPEAYRADITYGTNNEYGFDYLRDNMVVDKTQMAQRPLHYALVDEIDSILIDEARTPLIISAPAEESADTYYQFSRLVTQLLPNADYNIDEKMRAVTLTEEGINKMEKSLGIGNIYAEGGLTTVHHLEQALKAYTLFRKDRDYVVKDGEIIIIDEFTGRMLPGRRYSEGLHQAIEAKEGVAVKQESQTLATITFQNYFRIYKKLAGMTGTALTEAEEFGKIYRLQVLVVPTNRPMVRRDLNDLIYKNELGKFMAVAGEVKKIIAAGQPVLLGTISIEKNEILSELLSREGVDHKILNAKFHEQEAEIIAQAGRRGAVTLATNMAGRGVDIILGGKPPVKDSSEFTAWQAEHEAVVAAGGLYVIGTERHESRRIDNQLRGRSGRQGDPGCSRFYISLEDDLMRIFGPERIKGMMEALHFPEDLPIENKFINSAIESAQKKVEAHNFDIRKHLLEYDDVMNKQRETIYRRRRQAIAAGDDSKQNVLDLILEEIREVVAFHTAESEPSSWDLEEIYEVVNSIFTIGAQVRLKLEEISARGGSASGGEEKMSDAREMLIGYLYELAVVNYNKMESAVAEKTSAPQAFRQIERGITLRAIDALWVEHLDAMDHLRTGIGLRGYGQLDPLVEYKRESFGLFKQMLVLIRQQIVYSIFKVGDAQQIASSLLERQGVSLAGAAKTMEKGHDEFGKIGATVNALPTPKARDAAGQKIGRNDPCYCQATKPDGAPIKYKDCHGR